MVLFVLDLYVASLRKQFSVSEETYSLGTMNMGTENPAEIALRWLDMNIIYAHLSLPFFLVT